MPVIDLGRDLRTRNTTARSEIPGYVTSMRSTCNILDRHLVAMLVFPPMSYEAMNVLITNGELYGYDSMGLKRIPGIDC